jgi:glycosyltransferase involved in cell wall biosynthesis
LTNLLVHAREITRIVKDEGIDLLVLSNLAAPFAYTLLSKLSNRRVPTIVDLPDYYPTSAVGYVMDPCSLPGEFVTSALDLMLGYIIRHSSAVTVASNALMQYASARGAPRVFLVPNGISEEFLKLHNGTMLREKLGFEFGDIVAGYIGSVDFWLDLRSLLRGVVLAKKKCPEIKCLIVGKGLHNQQYANMLTRWVAEERLQRDVVRLGFVPYDEVPRYAAAMNVGTIPFDVANPTAYYAAPNKMWEYLSQMRPVIATPIPESLNNIDCLSIAREPTDYARHLLAIARGNAEMELKVKKGYERARGKTWKRATEIFASVCQNVLDSERAQVERIAN